MSSYTIKYLQTDVQDALTDDDAATVLQAVLNGFLASDHVGPHKERVCMVLNLLISSLPAPPCPSAPGSLTTKDV
jgi:hypothetical protein